MGRRFIGAHLTFCIAGAICAFWLTCACCQEAAKQPKLNSGREDCSRIKNEHMRMHCLEQTDSKAAPAPQQQPTSGTWQLARKPNPAGGPDSISIEKITNPTPSGQDIAGLMLRCAEGAATNVLIVLAAPLPARRGGFNDDRVHRKRRTTRIFGTASGESICSRRKHLAVGPGACRVHDGQ